MSGEAGELPPAETEVGMLFRRHIMRLVDIQGKALDIDNERDKRQAAFSTKRLEYQNEADKRRTSLGSKALIWVGFLIAATAALLLYMAFFGNESQSANAIVFVEKLGIGLAGYGIIHAMGRAVGALLRRGRN